MGLAYRLYTTTVRDLISIREDHEHRLTTSPFGITPEQYATNPPKYVGASAPWKGLKGLEIEGFASAVLAGKGRMGSVSASSRTKLIAGLRKAISISQSCRGITGTELFMGKLYPKKCIEQMRKAGKA